MILAVFYWIEVYDINWCGILLINCTICYILLLRKKANIHEWTNVQMNYWVYVIHPYRLIHMCFREPVLGSFVPGSAVAGTVAV